MSFHMFARFVAISWVFLFGWSTIVVYCGVCWFGMPKIYMSTTSPILVLSLEVFVVVSLIPSLYYYVDFCYCVASFLRG